MSSVISLDVSEILPGLYQGGYPRPGDALSVLGVDVLVLCARELQPLLHEYPGVKRIIRCPIDDTSDEGAKGFSRSDHKLVLKTGAEVASLVRRGAKVLVTCAMGLNRSGLVVAVACKRLQPQMHGRDIVALIRKRRAPIALFNTLFQRIIYDLR